MPEALLGGHRTTRQHDHVQEIASGDDADAAPEVLGELVDEALGVPVAVEGDGQAEADEEEKHGRGEKEASVNQMIARPPHADVHPVARGVVDDHQDERDTAHPVDELKPPRSRKAFGGSAGIHGRCGPYWITPRCSTRLYDHTVTR